MCTETVVGGNVYSLPRSSSSSSTFDFVSQSSSWNPISFSPSTNLFVTNANITREDISDDDDDDNDVPYRRSYVFDGVETGVENPHSYRLNFTLQPCAARNQPSSGRQQRGRGRRQATTRIIREEIRREIREDRTGFLFTAAEVGVVNPRYTLKYLSNMFDLDEISGTVSLKPGAKFDYDAGPNFRQYRIAVIISSLRGRIFYMVRGA